MDIVKISGIDLKKGLYKEQFPDVYKLKGLIEKSFWHDNQDVFDHTIAVFEALKQLITDPKFTLRLSKKIGFYTKKEILLLLALYHDIGKPYIFTKDKNGLTNYKSHPEMGSLLFEKSKTNFPLSPKEKNILAFLILHHGLASRIADIYEQKNVEDILKLFRKLTKDWAFELTVLLLADLEGNDLKKTSRESYLKRKKTLINMLEFYLEK